MGKALPLARKFQPDSLGARAPQSFRAGIVAPGRTLLGGRVALPAANECYHPLRDGSAAVQEDAFWHDAYAREPYYVPGRGYDQYRPAYAMGWQAAFDFTASDFGQIEQELEHRWESHDTSSLLDWGQVRDAVYAAWMRARQIQMHRAAAYSQHDVGLQLRPIQRLLLHTLHDVRLLLRKAEPPPSAFVRQVVDRHVGMLQTFADGLAPSVPQSTWTDWAAPWLHLSTTLHHAWAWLRSWMLDINADKVLQLCDVREQQLLALYAQLLGTENLPPEYAGMLQRQAHLLRMHHAKLQWVRQEWPQRH